MATVKSTLRAGTVTPVQNIACERQGLYLSIEAVLFDFDPLWHKLDTTNRKSFATTVQWLTQHQVPFRVLTDDSLHTREEIAAFVQRDVPMKAEHVALPGAYLARVLSAETPRATVFLLGSGAVRTELEEAGLRVIDEPEEIGYLCDYVVAAADPTFSYEKLVKALACFETGCRLAAVEQTRLIPFADALLPAGGPVAAALGSLSGRKPAYTAGMANAGRLLYEAQELGVNPANCLVVGHAGRGLDEAVQEAGMSLAVVEPANPAPAEPKDFVLWQGNAVADLCTVLQEKIRLRT